MERNFVISKSKAKYVCTGGICAAAAATAAALMIFTGEPVNTVSVRLPKGKILFIDIEEPSFNVHGVRCCVKAEGGSDSIDSSGGNLIYADVNLDDSDEIHIDGSIADSYIRKMIRENVRKICIDYGYSGGVNIVISAPSDFLCDSEEEISDAESLGIVEPISEKILIDCLKIEMLAIKERGFNTLLAFPDDNAEDFVSKVLRIYAENKLKFGSYLEKIIDFSLELDYKELLIVGHVENMIKAAAGIMSTDIEMTGFGKEIFACYAGLYGASSTLIAEILSASNADHVLDILKREKLQKIVMQKISERALYHINKRVDNKIKVKLIIYSNRYGVLN